MTAGISPSALRRRKKANKKTENKQQEKNELKDKSEKKVNKDSKVNNEQIVRKTAKPNTENKERKMNKTEKEKKLKFKKKEQKVTSEVKPKKDINTNKNDINNKETKEKKIKKDKKEKKKTKSGKAKKKPGKSQQELQKQREKRKERKAKYLEELAKKKRWLLDLILNFCKKHYIIASVTVTFTLFLIGLRLAVSLDDDRHPSKHPNITDHVTFSFKIKNGPSGDLVFGLYGNDCPKTVKNFVMLANHDNGYGYEDSRIYGIIPQKMILGGDIVNNDGTSGKSALGESFEEENLKLRHKIRGTIGMMNLKNNEDSQYSSQFYITLGDCSNFDGQTVLFGHVLEGLPYLSILERIPTDKNMHPKQRITIVSTKHSVVKTK